jgi:peptide/nickel transport system substrate-binding protein
VSAAAIVATASVIAGCGGGDGGPDGDTAADAVRGGTLRLATTGFDFDGGFDPVIESTGFARGLYGNLLLRNLVGYRHRSGAAGNELVPDLAREIPEPSGGGTTFTFKLKQGIKFGPPLSREITSKDVAYAFERIAAAPTGTFTPLYDVVEGLGAFRAGTAKRISGIQTPDAKTITFKLTKPVGDFLHLLALPAAAPVPREVAGCFAEPGGYGRVLIADGPYMVEGSDTLDASRCGRLTPLSGFDPAKRLVLVRNPSYDPATDSVDVRSANVDRVTIAVVDSPGEIFARIERGELDGSPDTPPAAIVRKYEDTQELRDRLKAFPADTVWYISMNLTTPPFDDVHVRRAANLAIDRARLQQARGGPTWGSVATHIVPESLYRGAFAAGYDPYPLSGEQAKEEMKKSRYDADKDGVCDRDACRGVVNVSRNLPEWREMDRVITESFDAIGIRTRARELPTDTAYRTIGTVAAEVPITATPSWPRSYPDPGTFLSIFQGTAITPTDNVNHSLVGLTAAQARSLGVKPPAGGVPSVDRDVAGCSAKFGGDRDGCWAALDKKLTEDIVPWIPYLFSNKVEVIGPALTGYDYDQSSGEMAYAHVGVDPAKQR